MGTQTIDELIALLTRLRIANPRRYQQVAEILREIVPKEELLARQRAEIKAAADAQQVQRLRGRSK